MRPSVLEKAWEEFREWKSHDKVKRYDKFAVVDYGLHSSIKRLFILDVASRTVTSSHHMAHGSGSSDPRDPGKAITFSNRFNSHCSSLGAVSTGGVYYGKYGRSLRLHGLEKGLNDNIYMRTIVLHKSDYVTDRYIKVTGRCGQSWGCLAVDQVVKDGIIDQLKDGCFIWLSR